MVQFPLSGQCVVQRRAITADGMFNHHASACSCNNTLIAVDLISDDLDLNRGINFESANVKGSAMLVWSNGSGCAERDLIYRKLWPPVNEAASGEGSAV